MVKIDILLHVHMGHLLNWC